ncbi:phosphotriesterase [uncultured Imperialibacter sp.]|uniref:phosphotriesterase family protein n=1 Tax=uncultured Imperialibacter sp. TaxID=1672639 RepID=UPI0030D878B6|tara:strand:+ start:8169 stop:9179 length:1011 start_codon:yes stop_codon:yes gene_type:complete
MRLYSLLSIAVLVALSYCNPATQQPEVISVNGKMTPSEMGTTLIHEHILVDFIGADSVGYHRWDRDSVIAQTLPFLVDAKKRGVNTFIDCTPAYLGRDPWLLQELSELSGLTIITNTGYYGAVGNKYLPEHAFTETAEQLATRWIDEFQNGIEGSGVRPGFIKISVNSDVPLSTVDQKLVRAAAITHLATGMTIASHTGPALPALEEIALLKAEGVDPSAFIWVHAQIETDFTYYNKAYDLGAWISFDGVVWDVEEHLKRLIYCKKNGLLDKVLISHDAGWYSPGELNGGDFKPFTAIFDELIPLLKQNDFSEKDIDQLLRVNPARAFAINVKAAN